MGPRKRTRRRLDPDQRRDEILRAATRAFAARPYDEVHVDEIAADAGASRTLVNHYFGDKRALFLAVARANLDRIPDAVRTDLGLPIEGTVDANTAAWLDLVEARRGSFLVLLGLGPLGRDPEVEAVQDELRDRLARRMLANHLGTPDPPPEALITMRATIGLIQRALLDWASGRGGTRAQTHALIAESILASVRDVLPAVVVAGETDDPAASGES
ncbi:MAG TPA: TetR/AcrR family transcriptional regulator [Solirubrobacterales bacterium]|nr:TetR/AcrR family transcriptional regulator [Solirubrobacterales bacterium]